MRKIIQYSLFIILGNFLCFKFAFTQDNYRFIALFGFLLIFYSITFQLPFLIAEILSKRKFSYTIAINSDKSDKQLNKPGIIWLVCFVLLAGIQICSYMYFFGNQENLLLEKGVEVTTIVVDKKFERRGRRATSKHYIYYNYQFNGKTYKHSVENDNFEINDTIKIKLLPEKPDNHIVIE
jgi:hypothetical protein